MDCKSVDTRIILENLGHDIPLKWRESFSGIEFEASQFEMLQALFGMNELLSQGSYVTLEDFLMSINNSPIIFPKGFDQNMLGAGWGPDCFTHWDNVWVDITFDVVKESGKVIFVFQFVIPYCNDCLECEGCDMPSYYDWASSRFAKQATPMVKG